MVKKRSIGNYFKNIDLFQNNIAFREDGGDSFRSMCGAWTSLFIAITVIVYGYNKFDIMFNYQDTKFNEYTVIQGLSEETFG